MARGSFYGEIVTFSTAPSDKSATAAIRLSQPHLAYAPNIVAPTLVDGRVEARHVDLRPFAVTGSSTWVLPGGLTRVAQRRGNNAAEELDRLQAVLGTLDISTILRRGLHEFLDPIQRQLIAITRELSIAFFGDISERPQLQAASPQIGKQCQSLLFGTSRPTATSSRSSSASTA